MLFSHFSNPEFVAPPGAWSLDVGSLSKNDPEPTADCFRQLTGWIYKETAKSATYGRYTVF